MTDVNINDSVSDWFSKYSSDDLVLTEFNEDEDNEQRYVVTKVFSITPKVDNKLYIEVWIARNSLIGIGIELEERITRRLGKKKRVKKKDLF